LNPVLVRGRARDEFDATVGDSFTIGETTFTVLDDGQAAPAEPDLRMPMAELTCSREELGQVRFLDADERITVLARLPEVIRHSPSEQDLEARVLDVLLQGIPRAEAAAVVRLEGAMAGGLPNVAIHSLRFRGGQGTPFHPSRRLVTAAVAQRKQSVLNVWSGDVAGPDFTVHTSYDWALCVPMPDEPTPGWGLYVAGWLEQSALRREGAVDGEPLKA